MNEKLKKRQEARKAGCEFMNEREKGDFIDLETRTVTLLDGYKLHGDDGDYWAFIVDEESEWFYFANTGLATILDDAAEIAAEEGTSVADVVRGVKIHIGALEQGKKGRRFRPVDIV